MWPATLNGHLERLTNQQKPSVPSVSSVRAFPILILRVDSSPAFFFSSTLLWFDASLICSPEPLFHA
jgi:hypothetical protein